jgi:hypothetical protein
MSDQTAPAQPDEATRELLATWYMHRAQRFDPSMLPSMLMGAAGAPYAIEHGDSGEFVSMPRDVFIRLLKSASQPQMQPENYHIREP